MLVVSYNDLLRAFRWLINDNKGLKADLYDIWSKGAPSPDSIIRDVKHYRPDVDDPKTGVVKRVLPIAWLKPFLKSAANRNGIPLSDTEIYQILGE